MASPHTPQRVWSSLRDLADQNTKGNLAADGPFVIEIELQVEAGMRSWLRKNLSGDQIDLFLLVADCVWERA